LNLALNRKEVLLSSQTTDHTDSFDLKICLALRESMLLKAAPPCGRTESELGGERWDLEPHA
jgi:hypothetical protein